MRLPNLPRDWLLVFCIVIATYLFVSQALPRISGGVTATYLVKPLLYGLLAFYILRLPRHGGTAPRRLRGLLIKLAFGVAAFQIYLAVVAGFLDKFGKSPNSFSMKGILINLFFVGMSLAGTELSRAWLINRLLRRPATFLPIFITLVYTFFMLPLNQIPTADFKLETVTRFLGSSLLPVFMKNLLASFLALWGGALPALAYRGALEAFDWFCPVLPDLNWAMKAMTATAVPMVGMVVIHEIIISKQHPGKARKHSNKGLVGWVITGVAAVIAIWFSLGVFPVRPTVISSGSMRPGIEVGDIVIVAKQNPRRLKVGDIVQYRRKSKEVPTVHRIISVTPQEGGGAVFITKGDANKQPDSSPVYPEQVMGKVVSVVPKVGWASIAIKQLFAK